MGLILGGICFLTAITGLWVVVADLVDPDLQQMRFGLTLMAVPIVFVALIAWLGSAAPIAPASMEMTIEQAETILADGRIIE